MQCHSQEEHRGVPNQSATLSNVNSIQTAENLLEIFHELPLYYFLIQPI